MLFLLLKVLRGDILGILVICFSLCLFAGSVTYTKLYKSRKLFSDRYGMIIASVMSNILSFTFSFFSYFYFSATLVHSAFFSVLIGAIIGICFGALVKYHTLLAGWFNGVLGSLMGLMLAAVIKNPSLCSLPADLSNNVYDNTLFFSVFITILTLFTCSLINYSFRI